MGKLNVKNRIDFKLIFSLVLIFIESFLIFLIISSMLVYNIFLLSLLLSITCVLMIILLIDIYPKLISLIKTSSVLLLIVLIISALWAILFGNGEYWYLKYSLGILIGIITAFQLKNIKTKFKPLLLVFVSTNGILLCEEVEYILVLDPTLLGSVIFPYTLDGLSNALLVLLGVDLTAYLSYFITKGIINNS